MWRLRLRFILIGVAAACSIVAGSIAYLAFLPTEAPYEQQAWMSDHPGKWTSDTRTTTRQHMLLDVVDHVLPGNNLDAVASLLCDNSRDRSAVIRNNGAGKLMVIPIGIRTTYWWMNFGTDHEYFYVQFRGDGSFDRWSTSSNYPFAWWDRESASHYSDFNQLVAGHGR